MTTRLIVALLCLPFAALPAVAADWQVGNHVSTAPTSFTLASSTRSADIVTDPGDFPVVALAAGLFQNDVQRVTGSLPKLESHPVNGDDTVLVGTLGHSGLIDQLAKEGRLRDIASINGKWEATSFQIVDKPFPGVRRAFVIVGSDRRGTAYGLMTLSERIGVSPWVWWGDVPVTHQSTLVISQIGSATQSPDVKYRGIFINDEDAGMNPWASKTFDPDFGNIGPKTYAKVYELLLRLKLNYLWPAMHPCTTEFASVPQNAALADQYGIVMGASHTEVMLQNNVWWPKSQGPWNYGTNHDNIYSYWETSAKARGQYEAVWTLGIRGIHDSAMQGPRDMPGRVTLVQQAITDQRSLIAKYVTPSWGPVAQCFVPYKEVQPIYDAGLQVPPDVTLVWADDNFGYMRRLSSPAELTRPGGAGFYYRLSYLGGPHAYTWINTTPPALMWEEMHKGWENGARTIWMLNVGDIKPAEMGIDFYSRLAWNVSSSDPESQPRFLAEFARENFGAAHAAQIADFASEYYRLGQIRKPEFMSRSWAASLSQDQAAALKTSYGKLLDADQLIVSVLPAETHDAWTEMVGYPARMLAASGLVFLANRDKEASVDVDNNELAIEKWHSFLDAETDAYNNQVAGGKWRNMMTVGEFAGPSKSIEAIPWPWLPKKPASASSTGHPAATPEILAVNGVVQSIPASAYARSSVTPGAHWSTIAGLGYSGQAVALLPATVTVAGNTANTPSLEYDITTTQPNDFISVAFLPTFRLYPGMKEQVSVAIDGATPQILEVPGSGADSERDAVRHDAILSNRVILSIPGSIATTGKHTIKIVPVDPAVVIDEILVNSSDATPEPAP